MARLARYEWSSAGFHTGTRPDDLRCRRVEVLEEMIGDWRRYLSSPEEDEQVAFIRQETAVGRPVADETFIRKLEGDLGLPLRRRPVGRPKGSESRRSNS